MPVPDLRGRKLTHDEIVKEMAKEPYGWSKEIEFPWVVFNPRSGETNIVIFRANADAMPSCTRTPDCGINRLTFVKLFPSGVMHTCAICGKTMGPLANEDMKVVETKRGVSMEEIERVLEISKQHLPSFRASGDKPKVVVVENRR